MNNHSETVMYVCICVYSNQGSLTILKLRIN